MSAVVQLGDYSRAGCSRPTVAWTRRPGVADALPRGAIAPFRILALSDEGGRKEGEALARAGAEGRGRAPRARRAHGRRARDGPGGYDFEKSKFNRATQAMRQWARPSSRIVYAAALETLGYTPATILVDSPLSFPDPWNGSVWSPAELRRRVL
jgi:penicillin-binding protein 1A